jgi:hypothetical protein
MPTLTRIACRGIPSILYVCYNRINERFVPWFYSEATRYLTHPYAGLVGAIFVVLFIATIFI